MKERSDARAVAARRAALGQLIRRHRGETPQSDLAVRLGVSQASISSWELGGVSLTLEQLAGVEAALGLRAGVLLIEAGYVDEALGPVDWNLALARRALQRAVEDLVAEVHRGTEPGRPDDLTAR